jgi:hypothetical protein
MNTNERKTDAMGHAAHNGPQVKVEGAQASTIRRGAKRDRDIADNPRGPRAVSRLLINATVTVTVYTNRHGDFIRSLPCPVHPSINPAP